MADFASSTAAPGGTPSATVNDVPLRDFRINGSQVFWSPSDNAIGLVEQAHAIAVCMEAGFRAPDGIGDLTNEILASAMAAMTSLLAMAAYESQATR